MYKVLLADDEPWVIYVLERLINWEASGFTVVDTAYDGVEALEKVKQEKPNLLISDIRMPGANGIELVEKIREANESTVVIFISGHKDFADAQKAIRLGAFDYLTKQIQANELLNALQRVKEFLDNKDITFGGEKEIQEPSLKTDQITAIINYMEEHCMEELHLRDLAKKFYLTENYLSWYIKQRTNQNFTEFIVEKRISLAQKFLEKTEMSVQEIAERVGYVEYSYFSKLFKKRTGFTATDYRKLHGECREHKGEQYGI